MLLSSELESFGIVLIEAMACGVPPVAFGLPGVTAVVEDGVTGLLAAPGDVGALAVSMRAMLEMPEAERAAMAAAGRAACEARYAWPRVVDRVEAVYAEVAA
jgi:glycosyltransferase involved in cell wall biosynthesis